MANNDRFKILMGLTGYVGIILLVCGIFFWSSTSSWVMNVVTGNMPATDFEELWRISGFSRPYEMSRSNYPPFALVILGFLSRFDAILVVAFLTALNYLIITKIVRLTLSESGLSPVRANLLSVVFPIVLGPLQFATFRGSTELLLAPFVWSSYACFRSKKSFMASGLLGLVIAFKPYLIFALVLLVITTWCSNKSRDSSDVRERPIQVLLVAPILALALNIFGWVWLGREPVGTVLKSLTNLGSTSVGNASLSAHSVGVFGWRTAIFAMRASLNQRVTPNLFATGGTLLLLVLLVLTVCLFLRDRTEYLFLICIMVTICISPLSPYYRMLIVVVPLVVELPGILKRVHRPALFSLLFLLLMVDIPSAQIQEVGDILWIDVLRFPGLFFLTIWCIVGIEGNRGSHLASKAN